MPCKQVDNMKDNNLFCVLCGRDEVDTQKLGQAYKFKNVCAHHYCLLFTKELLQRGRDHDGIQGFLPTDILAVKKTLTNIVCFYCKKKGGHIQCSIKSCQRCFHLPCGIKNNSLHQFTGKFLSFCHDHRPTQSIPSNIRFRKKNCPICLTLVDTRHMTKAIWAKCCNLPVFHRDCIQKQALSSGYYFFRCPLCNNQDKFLREMSYHGIFIPEQDASWERETNAYRELRVKYSRCDADVCHCTKGRNFNINKGRWKLFICQFCGSQGTHQFCSGLENDNRSWDCKDCTEVLSRGSAAQQSSEADTTASRASTSQMAPSSSDTTMRPDSTSNNQEETTPQLDNSLEEPSSSCPASVVGSRKRKHPDDDQASAEPIILRVEAPRETKVSLAEMLADPEPQHVPNCVYKVEDDLTPQTWTKLKQRCKEKFSAPHNRRVYVSPAQQIDWNFLIETGFWVTMRKGKVVDLKPRLRPQSPRRKQTARKSCRGNLSHTQAAMLRQSLSRPEK